MNKVIKVMIVSVLIIASMIGPVFAQHIYEPEAVRKEMAYEYPNMGPATGTMLDPWKYDRNSCS